MQNYNGMWPWFASGDDSKFVTLHVVAGIGRLRAMGVAVDVAPALKALEPLDEQLTRQHRGLLNAGKGQPWLDENHLDPWIAHHLYARSFFRGDQEIDNDAQAAHGYFLDQARKHWSKLDSRMAVIQVALALWRDGDTVTPVKILAGLRETAVNRPETGMYWPDKRGDRLSWWQAPVETQALAIQAFAEIAGDAKAVDDLRVWLIQQKRSSQWASTKATAEAVQALLMTVPAVGERAAIPSLLTSDEVLEVSLGGKVLDPGGVEAGTGAFTQRIAGAAVVPEMAAIKLRKKDPGIAWASVHWQYLEDVEKLAGHGSDGLKLEKQLFVRRAGAPDGQLVPLTAGPLRVGEALVTRLVVTTAQPMEFVHLKDARGSGTEPATVLSGHNRQGAVSYYEVTRDTATHLFIDSLPAGVHVFEINSRVQLAGIYQSGIAEVRSMYAPEFHARSGSVRIEVLKE